MNTQDLTKFETFPKLARLARNCIITEKIDGINTQVCITEDGQILAGSSSRWITLEEDNFGFAKWVKDNSEVLMQLGVGRHFGEWWGVGIQRVYDLNERRWSLFNTIKFCERHETPKLISAKGQPEKYQTVLPSCCRLVPVLYEGPFETLTCELVLDELKDTGSIAAPEFDKPEGLVCYHVAGNIAFKKTIEKDETPKSLE